MFCNARNLLRCLLLLPACSRLVSPAPALAQGWIEIDRPGTPARPSADLSPALRRMSTSL